ncbi:hypothetical protein A2331_04705 [Candidatus Falkowbacteria bacterium RIFOXYB2_FULL_34_18]|uniref:Methyltransferase domain-containing protein n=1 Tax=Candidatus Falkowbacteria bacterium RIFOXYD2_FULL_34_120 TaxID=1798007 RepID=A0A1F5TQA3_9BACT|nr:MAG: hypothetical protein A2331_04705 [Candidatus Falkowbacteria bacterium RIFOXYB2_FULL_34_18]OGF29364.1 MAG: hypothetical protein A2500_06290 [Candidatus Falkowbacteria bacterium RIFOXYC12_FULL_34_55]OGF36555.1 MAG: hypothetical protein A2466_07330 [Candidatus Falkowbacteria bacterium RIFOXYC2_FULL_34_220]OGF38787.1 MAG: hypothetical protein A2515_03440 [Candidatus Falkowbacteria bacterium RIFOXYD12_FULL_34_57]OGF41028.1 MAG: hypothetical protein A2531_03685 [Candidatus Falkowbacteria bact
MAIFLFFLILLITFFIFFVIQFYNIVFRSYAPFISTKRNVIKKIVESLNIKEDSIIYELGCGRAGFLRAIGRKYPRAKMFGVEYSFLPFLIAGLQDSLTNNNITILKKNFFKVDLSRADMIYCYLNLETMKRLEEKFKKECKHGAIVVSCSFPMPTVAPQKVIQEKGESIYFYNF